MLTFENHGRRFFHLANYSCWNCVLYGYRQAGKQIQGVIRSAYKIERQATGMYYHSLLIVDIKQTSCMDKTHAHQICFVASGLRDILRELPRAEASKFRSQVSILDINHRCGVHMFV